MNKRSIRIIVVVLVTIASLQIAKASPLAGKPVLNINFQLPPPPPPPPLGRPHFRHHRHHRYYRHHGRVVVHLPPPPPAPPRP